MYTGKKLRGVSAVLFFLLASWLLAQQPAPPPAPTPPGGTRVAVIDLQRIVQESVVGQRLQKEIQAFQEKQQQELRKKETELRQLNQKLQEQAAVLAPDALRDLQAKLRDKQREIDRFREDAIAELQEKIEDAQAQLESQVRPIIAEVAREKGFDVVLNPAAVVFASRAVDITDDVIKRFNAKATQPTKTP